MSRSSNFVVFTPGENISRVNKYHSMSLFKQSQYLTAGSIILKAATVKRLDNRFLIVGQAQEFECIRNSKWLITRFHKERMLLTLYSRQVKNLKFLGIKLGSYLPKGDYIIYSSGSKHCGITVVNNLIEK